MAHGYYGNPPKIPEYTKEAFERYFENGWLPGSFGTAVLSNNLERAVISADNVNKKCLADIVEWLHHTAPQGSWGSEDAVAGWAQRNKYFEEYQKQRVIDVLKKDYK